MAHASRLDPARQRRDHALLVGAKILGCHVGRNQDVGGLGAGQRRAGEAGVLDIADRALRAGFDQRGQLLRPAADHANLLAFLEQVGRGGSPGIS